jgi:MoaA/NifB/PqqE/SkfB family radical SAM enzyme
MAQNPAYIGAFNQSIRILFREALRISVQDPAMALFCLQAIRQQNRAIQTRLAWEERGVHVPPFMIVSVTRRCNLHCHGCYARAQQRSAEAEMSPAELRRVLAEARELGISIVLLAGGEPLTRPDLLEITAEFPEIVFPLFTNGMLLDEAILAQLKKQRHVIPVISIEGHQIETDTRRGEGVYTHIMEAMARLHEANVFFGTSLTVTAANLLVATDERYVRRLLDLGCRLFFYVDYVPVQEGTESLTLTIEQRATEATRLEAFRQQFPGLFVALPGDEDLYGGWLAAGRGFIDVSPEGRLEPCPFAPYSDTSLRDMSLREALASPLLQAIRENEQYLGETHGGCALWENRAWVTSLLAHEPAAEPASA